MILATSETNLSVHENKLVGTLVANFVGDDENPGSVLSYQLTGVRRLTIRILRR